MLLQRKQDLILSLWVTWHSQELEAVRIQLSTLGKKVEEKDKKLEENMQALKDVQMVS